MNFLGYFAHTTVNKFLYARGILYFLQPALLVARGAVLVIDVVFGVFRIDNMG